VRLVALSGGLLFFVVLATANSGGYRYGISDQAFYEPAVRRAMDPSLFPRDAPLLAAESHLMGSDKIIGGLARALHVDLPPLFFAIYLVTLLTLGIATICLSRTLGYSWWATAVALGLLALRHRIAKTGANSLEGYMHPRELSFAFGVAAIAALCRRRAGWTVAWLAAAALLHTTTALWFAMLLGVMAASLDPRWRRWVIAAGALAAVAIVVALATRSLASRLVIMDRAWLDVLADKDYLFPTAWPAYAWIANAAYLPVIWLVMRQRTRLGLAGAEARAIFLGVLALGAVFLLSVPFTAAHLALAVQLQVTRVFWFIDFVAAIGLAWWITSSPMKAGALNRVRPVLVTLLVGLAAIGRGVYVMRVESPQRSLVQLNLPDSPWTDATAWLRRQPGSWQVLADPGHAWKYGSSVRVGAERDTVLESVKDSALAMYDRSLALRVADRTAALGAFDRMTTREARALGTMYGADVLLVDVTRPFDLPVLYRNTAFVVYDLR
jgi:hypothetical protein